MKCNHYSAMWDGHYYSCPSCLRMFTPEEFATKEGSNKVLALRVLFSIAGWAMIAMIVVYWVQGILASTEGVM